jgi:hypothetical protein
VRCAHARSSRGSAGRACSRGARRRSRRFMSAIASAILGVAVRPSTIRLVDARDTGARDRLAQI